MTSGTLKKSLLASVGVLMFGAAHAQDVERVEDDEKQEVDNITVTGTNIKGVDPAAPTVSIDREGFAEGGFTTLQDVFRDLPQNLNEIGPLSQDGTATIAAANTDASSGVSLRGLGPQSTLTLFNGRRFPGAISGRVFDISSIPLSAVERIDIVTGGNSAVYGADAVAGVVNIIPRRTFDGFETSASYGFNEGGSENFSGSATFGIERDKGGFIASYDYTEATRLDLVEAASATGSPLGLTVRPGGFDVLPAMDQHSIFVAARYDVNDSVEFFADILYGDRHSSQLYGYTSSVLGFSLDAIYENKVEQIAGTGGVSVALPGDWTFDFIGSHGNRETVFDSFVSFNSGPFSNTESTKISRSSQFTALAQGTALRLGEVDISTALGFEVREEGYKRSSTDASRTIHSVFGELRLPLVSAGTAPGLRRLELSAAARHDDYSDVGQTFNPQFGVIWQPVDDLTMRGTYATAFRAPSLFALGFASTSTQGFLSERSDPLSMSVAGISPVFTLYGSSTNLRPEEAETLTLGFDYTPSFFENLNISLSYFDIQYNNRIDQPADSTDAVLVLVKEDQFSTLINRTPTEAEARSFYDHVIATGRSAASFENTTGTAFDPETDDFLAVFPDLVLFDNQRQNIAVESVRGIDFTARTNFQTNVGDFSLGANGVYYFNYSRAITSTAPAVVLLNEVGKITDFKAGVDFGWRRGPLKLDTSVNYQDGYENPLVTPSDRVSSWTTLDLTLQYNGDKSGDTGFVGEGFSTSVNIRNLLDSNPPYVDGTLFATGFDAANHNVLGRTVTLSLTKNW